MRDNSVENGEEAFEDECLGAEELALDLAVFGGCFFGCRGLGVAFASFEGGGFHEECAVEAGGVVRGEVGG